MILINYWNLSYSLSIAIFVSGSVDWKNKGWHDDVIKWKHFPRYWSFVRGIHRSPMPSEFPSQRPVTRSFDAFFVLRLNKRLSKPSRHRWFERPSRSLWRHCNGICSSTSHVRLVCHPLWRGGQVGLSCFYSSGNLFDTWCRIKHLVYGKWYRSFLIHGMSTGRELFITTEI